MVGAGGEVTLSDSAGDEGSGDGREEGGGLGDDHFCAVTAGTDFDLWMGLEVVPGWKSECFQVSFVVASDGWAGVGCVGCNDG